MSERVVWGLDIGQTALHAVKLEKLKGSRVGMTDSFFLPIEFEPGEQDRDEAVREALEEFVAIKKPMVPVVISLPGYTTLFRNFPMPPVAPGKMREVVSYEAKQLIPYPLDEVLWDYQEMGFNEDTGELQIALLCCRKDIIDNILEMTDELKLVVEDIQVGPVALVNFFQYDSPSAGRRLLLDSGSKSTDFVMFDDESFWLRSIVVCGSDVTRSLMKKFNMSYIEAEELKASMADEKQAARVFKVVEPTIRQLAVEVQKSVGFYRSTKRDADIEEMILAGNNFLLEGADQYMADSLGYGARTCDLPESIMISPRLDTEEMLDNRQVYGVAAGLALQGLGEAVFDCSLLPESRKFSKLIQSKEKFGWVAAVVVVVTVLLGIFTTTSRKPLYEEKLQQIRKVMALGEKNKKEYMKKMEQFEPELNRNRAMLTIPVGRGWIENVTTMINKQIQKLNTTNGKKVNPRSVDVGRKSLSQKKIAENLKSNIMKWPSSRSFYKKELAKYQETYKIKEVEDVEVREKMQKGLETQVLRRTAYLHNRQKKTFIVESDYKMVDALYSLNDDGVESWHVPQLDEKNSTDSYASSARSSKGVVEDESVGKKVKVLLVEFVGFTVAGKPDDMEAIKAGLLQLKNKGLFFYNHGGDVEYGFQPLRQKGDLSNSVSIPSIYDPSPKDVDYDSGGEGSQLDQSEKLSYSPYTNEDIYKFKVTMLYSPKKKGFKDADLGAVYFKAEEAAKKRKESLAPPPEATADDVEEDADNSKDEDKKATGKIK